MKSAGKIIFLDGAMGTGLSRKGLDPTPVSNLKNPSAVKDILKAYIYAGVDIIETNTFSATSARYANYRMINKIGVKLAKEAVKESKRKVEIAGSIGATGLMIKPVGSLSFEEAVKIFKSQIKVLAGEKVDLLIIETMDDISEMRAALIAAKEVSPELFVIATMTFMEDDRTSTGTPPEVAATVMESLGADVVGVNCSFGPEKLSNIIKRMKKVTRKPLIVQANAGIPKMKNDKAVYPIGPKEYTKRLKALIKAGSSYVGGCCGTTPAHIKLVIQSFKKTVVKKISLNVPLIISSRTKWVEFDQAPVIIGERINFIARPELNDNESKIINEGLRQVKSGAVALDVNLGKYENKTWEVLDLLSRHVDIPLVLDSQNPQHVEKAARLYPGILLLNSISGEEKKLKGLLPIAKKYGIPFIALCLDDDGIPESMSAKLRIYRKIRNRAADLNIDKNYLLTDFLTLAAASDYKSAVKTLAAINTAEINTVLGISNVSAGLPQRALLNQVFSVMAVQSGCSALIVNPLDTDLMYNVFASSLLSGRDNNAEKYLEYFTPDIEKITFSEPLTNAIVIGDTKEAVGCLAKVLKKNQPLDIIKKFIIPALDHVGDHYRERKIFLPQLIESAKTSEKVMNIIEKKLIRKGRKVYKKARIIIATVKGDIHDIGKNLVVLMLKNHSYDVKDMGVDVSTASIISEAIKWKADIIGLSSLMTTTMGKMNEVTGALKKKKLKIPVIIGGAAITGKYAKSIGAEYGKDAVDAVKIAGEVIKK